MLERVRHFSGKANASLSALGRNGLNPDATAFWQPWEREAASFDELSDLVYDVFEKWSERGHRFAWRGQPDARWSLHSSLYRRLMWSSGGSVPEEIDVATEEREILAELHRWGLHHGEFGRLSVLNQHAVLQHYGAPTRLIDITFNPWIGIWFAVQERRKNGDALPVMDARLFALDVTDRLTNEKGDECRFWEDDLRIPWPKPAGTQSTQKERDAYKAWITEVQAWMPPRFHPRLAAQNGGFIFGGVPATGAIVWPKSTQPRDGRWPIEEVRKFTSVPMRVHKLATEAGGPSEKAMYTIRIKADAVEEIRLRLEKLFGYQPSTIYPDYTGFADFGTPELKTAPPTP
ncbi:MAG: FRG domain-containing protein [Actinomycetota bacterium]|nr:FRG domain-containing protein [Actinomycetota bacterium]